jgi:hypothetical protein
MEQAQGAIHDALDSGELHAPMDSRQRGDADGRTYG